VRQSGYLVAGYWYRDDSLELWDAIWAFVEQVLSLYYDDELAVISDIELSATIAELRQHSIMSLVRTLTAYYLEFQTKRGPSIPPIAPCGFVLKSWSYTNSLNLVYLDKNNSDYAYGY